MSQILSKTIIKLMTSSLVRCDTSFFVLGVKVQLLANFPIFTGIKLKIGGGVNSEALISHFVPILPYKMNLIKIKEFLSFFTNFMQPLFNKSVAMVTG